MRNGFILSVVVTTILWFASSAPAQKHPQKASPFDGIRWVDEQPQVQVGEDWYLPISIDGIQISKII